MPLKTIIKPGKKESKRFEEIDILRGLAIILMIIGHVVWDLHYFGVYPMNKAFYSTLSKIVPQIFFLVVGFSLIVSYNKRKMTPDLEMQYYKHLILRGLKIFGLGMVLTAFSFVIIPDRPVYFGVLHCIGVSIILSIPLLKFKRYSMAIAVPTTIIGYIISQQTFQNPNLIQFILGMQPEKAFQYTVDYFPILPWFGVVILGIAIGNILYCGNQRRFRIPDLSKYKPTKLFSWCGKHSLGLYLLHQPVIGGILYLFVRTF